jgi:hypothetical protein
MSTFGIDFGQISDEIAAAIAAAGAAGGGSSAPSGAGTSTAPPPGMPSDLQTALIGIPVAHAGNVITEEYHNSLRAAVLSISGYLGQSIVGGQAAVTLAPAFLPLGDPSNNPPWQITFQAAMPGHGATEAHGWMPVSLPDGARIQGITVVGKKAGTFDALDVALLRFQLDDPDQSPLTLSTVSLLGDPPWTAPVAVLGAGPTALEEYKLVDTSQQRFAVSAELLNASGAEELQINLVQIAYTRF